LKRFRVNRRISLLIMAILLPHLASAAEAPLTISELTYLDKQYMGQQRTELDDLSRANLGRQFNHNKDHDLRILQSLLDRNLVRAEQKKQLQGMGAIMGDLLASELNMHWVIYEDKVGRSRALRYLQTDNYLFPMTMISSRREVDNRSTVVEIYQRAVDIIHPYLPKPRFQ
jgi:hypothetical protein